MELEKGLCFCCGSNRVLVLEKTEVCEKLFNHLFGEVDFRGTKEKLSLLKWCPVCYQKSLFVLNDLDDLENLISDNGDQCGMCKNDEHIVKIGKSPYLVKILEEFVQKDVQNMCLKCIYILDLRETFKEKICSRYPQLKIRRKKTQPSAESPAANKRSRSNRNSSLPVIEISDDEEQQPEKRPSSNIEIFKKLKPLKSDKIFGNIKIIHNDPKFYAQIPYTKLQLYSAHNNSNQKTVKTENKKDDGPKKNIFFKIKLKSHNNRYSIVKSNSRSSKSKRKSVSFYSEEDELKKHNINSSLIINLLNESTDVSFNLTEMDTSESQIKKEETVLNESIEEHNSEEDEKVTVKDEIKEKQERGDTECSSVDAKELNESQKSDSEIKPKRYRPKPRSKQNKEKRRKDVDEVTENKNDPEKIVEKKRRKPGPLSKRKRRDSQNEETETRKEKTDVDEKERTLETDNDELNKDNETEETDERNKNSEKKTTEAVEEKRDEVEGSGKSEEKDKEIEGSDKSEEKESTEDSQEIASTKDGQESENENVEEKADEDENNANESEEKENEETNDKAEDEETNDKAEDEETKDKAEDEEPKDKPKDEEPNDKEEDETNDKPEDEEIKTKESSNIVEENEKNKTSEENEKSNESQTEKNDQESKSEDSTEPEGKKDETKTNEISNGDAEKEKSGEDSEVEKEKNGVGNDDDDVIDLTEFTESPIGENGNSSNKRKNDNDNADSTLSSDKKKKRVTFSDEVLESSYD